LDFIGEQTKQVSLERSPYPHMDPSTGYLRMDTKGPNCVNLGPLEDMPRSILSKSYTTITGTKSSKRKKKSSKRNQRIAVVYITEPATRMTCKFESNLFWVPFGRMNQPCQHKYIKEFAGLTTEGLKKVMELPPMPKPKFDAYLASISLCTQAVVVPIWKEAVLRIKLVSITDMNVLAKEEGASLVVLEGKQFLFHYEGVDLNDTKGTLVSCWLRNPSIRTRKVTYGFVDGFKRCYKKGYGSRNVSHCLDSLNCYRDERLSSRPHPSPFITDDDVQYHQYYNLAGDPWHVLAQPCFERKINQLTSDVKFDAEKANKDTVGLMSELCTKSILTAGGRSFGFVNGSHVDKCDMISFDVKQEIMELDVKESTRKHLSLEGGCLPTTCG
jgi:hypothetical protein